MSDLPNNSDADKLQGMEHEKQYDYQLPENYFFKSEKGLTKRIVERISYYKDEPEWMLKFRLQAFEIAEKKG